MYDVIQDYANKLACAYGEVVEKHNQECLMECIPKMKQPVTYNKMKWRGIKINQISRRESPFSEFQVLQRGKKLGKSLFIRISYDDITHVCIESYTE